LRAENIKQRMAVYRFRVAFEDYDDVVRDIEIRSTQTFEDLHQAIQQNIGFDGAKPASFYMSDDNWKKGQEITNRPLTDADNQKAKEMSGARLLDYILDPHQKIYYVFDLPNHWTFHVELVKIQVNVDSGISYPRCIRKLGEAPKQYGNVIAGPPPEPEDFDGTDILEEEEMAEEADEVFTGVADAVEPDEVPLAVESEDGTPSDFEEESGEIMGEDERKEEDF
jgi:hypothetical protein